MDNKRLVISLIRTFSPYYTLISLLIFTALLSSCSSHVAKQDGPPNFYVDISRIPNAVPKPEPLAKYGNMPSYVVFGKRYYTMKSSSHYEAIGTASWYGTKFHTHRTSSGEAYNMLSMTAAHKTLPLPTYVEVTNLKNGRHVIVKVNDRGPFESNRLIDLSYVAAKKLGMLGHGTATVKVKAINPYFYAQHPSPHFTSFALAKPHHRLNYARTGENVLLQDHRHTPQRVKSAMPHNQLVYLQVGAFRNKLRAEKLRQRLTVILATPVNIINPTAKINLYRVKVGPFKDIASAERISYKLQGIGIRPNKISGA